MTTENLNEATTRSALETSVRVKTNQTILGRAETQGLSDRGARTHHHPHEVPG